MVFDFVLIKKKHRRSMRNATAIPGEYQHALTVAGIDKKKIRNVVRKICTVRSMIGLQKDVKITNSNILSNSH